MRRGEAVSIGVKVKFKHEIKVSLPTNDGILKIPVREGRTGYVSQEDGVLVVRLDEPLQTGHDIAIDNVRWRDWEDALKDILIIGKGHLRVVSDDGDLL